MLTKPSLIVNGNEAAIMAELSQYKALADKYKKIADGYKLKPEQVKNFIRKDDVLADIKKRKVLEIIRNARVEK